MTGADEIEEPGERIAKYLARAGVASRREAERLIAQGIVTVDGETLTTPAFKVRPGMEIRIDGTRVGEKETAQLWRYHKLAGLVTTHKDPQGRPTVFAAVAGRLPRVISVGRLDLATEGLLLLTNDGALARRLELPATGWVRRYRARVHGGVDERALAALGEGVTIDGVAYKPIKAVLERKTGANQWLAISLTEGKNREVRKVMAHLGLQVSRLIRTAYGPFQLGGLAKDAIEEIPMKQLREQLGRKVSEEIGL
ncbi:MAG: pseudouridine synthase [Amphiplicatus sp.]